ncbi:DUF6414 family protein [Staphylococcus simulans]
MIFRDFLYLDEKMVKRYLTVIEDGLKKEVSEISTKNGPNWEFDISTGKLQDILTSILGIPLPSAAIKRNTKSEETTVQITKEITIEKQFDTLLSYIENIVNDFDDFDADNWNDLVEDEFVLFKGRIKLPNGFKNAKNVERGLDISNFVKGMGIDVPEIDEDRESMETYIKRLEKTKKLKVFIPPKTLLQNVKKYFYTELLFSNLIELDIEDIEELEEEDVYVLGKISKVLEKNEKETIFDSSLHGVSKFLNREERRKNKELFDFAVKPAIKIKTIAIYT